MHINQFIHFVASATIKTQIMFWTLFWAIVPLVAAYFLSRKVKPAKNEFLPVVWDMLAWATSPKGGFIVTMLYFLLFAFFGGWMNLFISAVLAYFAFPDLQQWVKKQKLLGQILEVLEKASKHLAYFILGLFYESEVAKQKVANGLNFLQDVQENFLESFAEAKEAREEALQAKADDENEEPEDEWLKNQNG